MYDNTILQFSVSAHFLVIVLLSDFAGFIKDFVVDFNVNSFRWTQMQENALIKLVSVLRVGQAITLAYMHSTLKQRPIIIHHRSGNGNI